uniref:Uncharacterized protein n=1 Tax=Neogobius melanostomus TaxID=47308 RepID=A0A8C6U7W2_9GOBI
MTGRCVNSLWTGTERGRIDERLKATLAGVLELELLRCKQLELVNAALYKKGPQEQSCVTSRRQQVSESPNQSALNI